jgi:hypothetical protein
MINSGSGYNVTANINANDGTTLQMSGTNTIGSPFGIISSLLSRVSAPDVGFSDNTTDGSASNRGLIWVEGQVGGVNFAPTLDTVAGDGSLITDG